MEKIMTNKNPLTPFIRRNSWQQQVFYFQLKRKGIAQQTALFVKIKVFFLKLIFFHGKPVLHAFGRCVVNLGGGYLPTLDIFAFIQSILYFLRQVVGVDGINGMLPFSFG